MIQSVKATINGQEYTLTYNDTSGKYEATLTAPSKSSYTKEGHYYPVSIKAADDYGNSSTVGSDDPTLGESLRLVVKEKVVPILTFTAPASGAYITTNKPTIQWKVTDEDSGVDESTISITVDGTKITSGITKTPVTGGFNCAYTPSTALSDGQHTIKIDASDHDGNAAVQKTVTFKVDTTPPALDVVSPVDGLHTNTTSGVVSGNTNDVTSSPVEITIKVNGTSVGAVTIGSDGAFSKNVTYRVGTNTIEVKATDSAGKSTTITRTVEVNTTAPVFTSIELVPNPVDAGATYIIKVSVE